MLYSKLIRTFAVIIMLFIGDILLNMIMSRKIYLLLLVFISCSIHVMAQTDYYYYFDGTKIPLTLNENKVLVSVPKGFDMVSERIRANVQPFFSITDEFFDIFFITRADLEKLASLDFWEEDAKSVIITPSYIKENDELDKVYDAAFSTPYLLVKLKKEEDINLLTSYIEKYRLQITMHRPSFPLSYTLAITLDSEKSPLECANEMFESGNFEWSVPDMAYPGYGTDEPNAIQSITTATVEESSEIYDLYGRQLTSKPTGGIYIFRGQKKLTKSQ